MKIGFLNIRNLHVEKLMNTPQFKNSIGKEGPDILIFAEANKDDPFVKGSTVGDGTYTVLQKNTRENANKTGKDSDTMLFLCKSSLYFNKKDDYVARTCDLDRKVVLECPTGTYTIEGIHWASPNRKGKTEKEVFKAQDACIKNHCKKDVDIKIGDFNIDLLPRLDRSIKYPEKGTIEYAEYERINTLINNLSHCGFKPFFVNEPTYKKPGTNKGMCLDYVFSLVNGQFFAMKDFLPGLDHKYIQFNIKG